jgi:hypothetical protein
MSLPLRKYAIEYFSLTPTLSRWEREETPELNE